MRIDLYLLPPASEQDEAALQLACRLAGKAWPQHRSICICCHPRQQARLDALLWQLPAGRFIAHGISGSDAAALAPVLIDSQPAPGSLLIQLLDHIADTGALQRYQRILDIVGADEQQRQAGRKRYRQYQQLTSDLHTHRL